MEPDRPTATAVAVEGGRIVAVGSLGEVRAARDRLDLAARLSAARA
jgi:predicted amidohydrolase YtcJ